MVGISSCSKKEIQPNTPTPTNLSIAKTFFVTDASKVGAKRFMCGWALENNSSHFENKATTHLVHQAMHCNIEFRVTENFLVGDKVNPSYPNDKDKWLKNAIKIPIKSHYYLENELDEYGRKTGNIDKNDSRSHYTRRPYMDLDLAGIEINGWAYSALNTSHNQKTYMVESVPEEDIVWDHKNNFLGFSMEVSHPYFGSNGTARFRFNFLKFDSDKSFKKTKYHQTSNRYFNLIHLFGKINNGDEEELYAGKWDLRQQHNLYLNSVPTNYQEIVKNMVIKWNRLFINDLNNQDVQATLSKNSDFNETNFPFNVVKSYPSKYDFDLRYPSIKWVQDRRISIKAPLGVGLAHSDIENGEILWAQIILFGGIIDDLKNRYHSPSLGSGSGSSHKFYKSLMKNYVSKRPFTGSSESKFSELAQQFSLYGDSYGGLKVFHSVLVTNTPMSSQASIKEEKYIGNFFSQLNYDQVSKNENESDLKISSLGIDAELSFEKKIPQWSKSFGNTVDSDDVLIEKIISWTIIHEVGHILGLGHQFRANTIPVFGSAPKKYTNHTDNKTISGTLLNKAENGHLNYTSVMDYMHGKIELDHKLNSIEPGIHDLLVMKYLYNSQVSTYDKENDTFRFFNVAFNGEITPDGFTDQITGKNYSVSYMPACNDLDANTNNDPKCNRFDYGHTAEVIVESYAESLKDYLTKILQSSETHSKKSYQEMEALSLQYSFKYFSRIKMFFNDLVYYLEFGQAPLKTKKYSGVLQNQRVMELWSEIKRDKNEIAAFSKNCSMQADQITFSATRELLEDKVVKEYCLASKKALKEIRTILSLKQNDETLLDKNSRYFPGGITEGEFTKDYANYSGNWLQLSSASLKLGVLISFLTDKSFDLYSGEMVPSLLYADTNLPHYRHVFPYEYGDIITTIAENNLIFPGDDKGKRVIGKTYLNAASMINEHSLTDKNLKDGFSEEYFNIINNQNRPELTSSILMIDFTETEGYRNFSNFKGTVVDLDKPDHISEQLKFEVNDIFILPNNEVIIRHDHFILIPLSKLSMANDKTGYVYLYKINFNNSEWANDNGLNGLKSFFSTKYKNMLLGCIDGDHGLRAFYETFDYEANAEKCEQDLEQNKDSKRAFFCGVHIPKEIGPGDFRDPKHSLLNRSLNLEHSSFQNFTAGTKTIQKCENTKIGFKYLLSTIALLNGMWLKWTINFTK